MKKTNFLKNVTRGIPVYIMLLSTLATHAQPLQIMPVTTPGGAGSAFAIDRNDNIYFDNGNNQIVRKDAVTGAITTIVGILL